MIAALLLAVSLGAAACSQGKKKEAGLPDCGKVQATDGGDTGWVHPECMLQSKDPAGLVFEARYPKAEAGQPSIVVVQAIGPGGEALQKIEEGMDSTFAAPKLEDIDQDGRDELMIPLATGNVNTTWAIWRATGTSRHMTRAGELSAVEIVKTESGYVAASARSSAAAWKVDFYQFDGAALRPIASAQVEASPDATGGVASVTCAVTDAGGLTSVKIKSDEAQKQFCAEPVVKKVFL
jgi:hypothetical protein